MLVFLMPTMHTLADGKVTKFFFLMNYGTCQSHEDNLKGLTRTEIHQKPKYWQPSSLSSYRQTVHFIALKIPYELANYEKHSARITSSEIFQRNRNASYM